MVPSPSMSCPGCQKSFAITAEMVGRVVACPFCQTQTKAVAGEATTPLRTSPRFTPPPPPKPQVGRDEPQGDSRPHERETLEYLDELPPLITTETSRPSEASPTQPLSKGPTGEETASPADVSDWLPPEYAADDDPAATAETKTPANMLQIDPQLTRIHRRDEKVPVRSFSRDEKDQRKKNRVLVVSLLGALVLITLFFVLMSLLATS